MNKHFNQEYPDLLDKRSQRHHIQKILGSFDFRGKVVIDLPSGDGVNSEFCAQKGATVLPFDLFPDFFKSQYLKCQFLDVNTGIPVDDAISDFVICQEGIEHFQDQLRVFSEFSRVLKEDGKLIVTTPSYSHLAAKIAYLCFESESVRHMPPNEFDSIWRDSERGQIYHGHIFLIGVQKLRLLGELCGLKLRRVYWVRASKTSVALLPILYPVIFLISIIALLRNKRRAKKLGLKGAEAVFNQQFFMNVNPLNLINKFTVLLFEKN